MRESAENSGGKLVAVWGSPNSGKTCLSVKLAQSLSERGRSVLLLLSGRTTPMLPCLCAPEELSNKRSLGSALAAPIITPALLRFNLIRYAGDANLSILALLKGETAGSYPQPGETQVTGMMTALRQLADHTVIDCGCDLATDALSRLAISQADLSLRLVCPEMRAVSFLASQLPLAEEIVGRQYTILSKINEDSGSIKAAIFDDHDFELPYCRELAQLYAHGELLQPLESKASRAYLRKLVRCREEILQEEISS